MMKKNFLVLVSVGLFAVSLILTGCLDTQVPPYLNNDIIADDKIIGQWIPIDPDTKDAPPLYTVIPSGDKLYQLHMKEDGKESFAQLTLFKLDGQTYLSLAYSDSEEIDTLQYYWESDALKLKGFNKKLFVELAQNEKLDFKYSVDESSSSDIFVHLEATTEQLRAFIEKHGAELFTDKSIEFKRINE